MEVQTFYGALDSIEAQYPGLDYTFSPHRRRLSRFSAHRRLFKVFDELGITDSEILSICIWEGTRCAKEKYEKDNQRVIRDTTADGVEEVKRRGGPVAEVPQRSRSRRSGALARRVENVLLAQSMQPVGPYHQLDDDEGSDAEQTDEDEFDYSVGVQLNQQLREAADARARGEPAVFDQQWEQWMREAMERDNQGLDMMLEALRSGRPFPTTANHLPAPSAPSPTSLQPSSSRPATAIPTASQTIGGLQTALTDLQASRTRLEASLQPSNDLEAALAELQSAHARLEAETAGLEADTRALERVVSGARTETAR